MQIAVSVLDAEPMPHAHQRPLEHGVEELDGVGMRVRRMVSIAPDVLAGRVVDPQMRPKLAADPAIGRQGVGTQYRASLDIEIFADEIDDRPLGMRFALAGPRPAATFGCGHDHLAASAAASLWLIPIGVAPRRLFATLAAHVCLVNSTTPRNKPYFVLHHATDALTEEPSCLLSDAKMLSQLDRRNSFARRGDQVKRREPCSQRQMRSFERRTMQHRKLPPTGVAAAVVRSSDKMRVRNRAAAGHTGPCGHRMASRCAQHAASSGKRARKVSKDMPMKLNDLTTKVNRFGSCYVIIALAHRNNP